MPQKRVSRLRACLVLLMAVILHHLWCSVVSERWTGLFTSLGSSRCLGNRANCASAGRKALSVERMPIALPSWEAFAYESNGEWKGTKRSFRVCIQDNKTVTVPCAPSESDNGSLQPSASWMLDCRTAVSADRRDQQRILVNRELETRDGLLPVPDFGLLPDSKLVEHTFRVRRGAVDGSMQVHVGEFSFFEDGSYAACWPPGSFEDAGGLTPLPQSDPSAMEYKETVNTIELCLGPTSPGESRLRALLTGRGSRGLEQISILEEFRSGDCPDRSPSSAFRPASAAEWHGELWSQSGVLVSVEKEKAYLFRAEEDRLGHRLILPCEDRGGSVAARSSRLAVAAYAEAESRVVCDFIVMLPGTGDRRVLSAMLGPSGSLEQTLLALEQRQG